MAERSSRSLLEFHGDTRQTQSAQSRERSAYKTLWTILILLALLIGCIVASIAILLISHEDSVQSWKIQPSVLLSFLSAVYSATLSGLFTTGIAIMWWRSIRHGSTLKQLHFISAGINPMDLIPAFLAGSGARRVALVAVVVLITNLSIGPLTQNSTSSTPHDVSKSIDMKMELAQEIPDGWFGTWGSFQNRGLHAAQGTFLNSSLTTSTAAGYYCPVNSTCSGSMPAAGINFACSTTSENVELLDRENQGLTVFGIEFNTAYSFNQSIISLTTKYVESVDGSCTGTLRTDICNITTATVRYPIAIRDTTLTLDLVHLVEHPDIITNYTSPADQASDDPPPEASLGPLLGLYHIFSFAYSSKALLTNDTQGSVGWGLSPELFRSPIWPTMFLDLSTSTNISSSNSSSPLSQKCNMVWSSPTLPLIRYMYDFMFRVAYAVPTSDTSTSTSTSYLQTSTLVAKSSQLWYFTNHRFLAASIAAMALGLLAALSLLYGFWQLERYVSLSPLETGKALGAPVFAAAGRKEDVECILKHVGREKVSLGGDELVWSEHSFAFGKRVWSMKSGGEDGGMMLREGKGGVHDSISRVE